MARDGHASPTELLKTPAEYLTNHFYAWENRGRGWRLWDRRVDLEPVFEPFIRKVASPSAVVDDGRRPNFLSSLFKPSQVRTESTSVLISNNIRDQNNAAPQTAPSSIGDVIELKIGLPPNLKVSPDAAESFLLSLSHCAFPISLEVIGRGDYVMIQFSCRTIDRTQLEQQLIGHFPELVVCETADTLSQQWTTKQQPIAIVEFGLRNEFVRPLGTFRSFEPDPLIPVISALSKLRAGEFAILQILFQATQQPWAEDIRRAVTNREGKPLFADAPEVTSLAKEKIARPLFAVVVRVAAQCESNDRAWRVARSVGASLRRFANPASNELIALPNDNYHSSEHERDLLDRATRRAGMLLNSEELAGLVHPPSASVRTEKLQRNAKKTTPAPAIALGHSLVLGHNSHRGQTNQVTLSPEQRLKHMFIAGSSGSGKTTLLKQLASQDIHNGDGLCVIDPHADFINDLLAQIPEERYPDVIILDPADECPVPFNILSAHSELEKNLLASDLASLFRRQCTTWGDQLDAVLTNSILAFLESEQSGTLADLRRFLVESEYRKSFLRTVKDEELLYYWTKEFPLLRGHPQAPILTRLNAFLRPKPIRAMVSQQRGSLDLRTVMDNKKILLVKLAQGAIGMDNSHLLGSLILSKIHQLALSRQNTAESDRVNFYVYCDEAQYFLTPSVTALLSGGRKFHVGLTLATQEFYALWNIDKEVASAVLANPHTRVCFRLGDIDAKKLEDGFSHFDAHDLQNLGVGEAIIRMERNEYDFNLKTLPPPTIDVDKGKTRREQIIELSRKQYGRKPEQTQVVAADTIEPRQRASSEYKQSETELIRRPVQLSKPKDHSTKAEVNPAPLGRGGQQHKYLQNLIKRLGEDRGFRVTIEQPVLSGTGSVDVSLERAGRKIACEISVSSTTGYEVKNIQKGLAAGYDQVVVLSAEKKALGRIKKVIEAEFDAETCQRVLCLLPEEFISFLDCVDGDELSAEKTVHGYKVKVKYKASATAEQIAQRQAIARVILQALKRLKDED